MEIIDTVDMKSRLLALFIFFATILLITALITLTVEPMLGVLIIMICAGFVYFSEDDIKHIAIVDNYSELEANDYVIIGKIEDKDQDNLYYIRHKESEVNDYGL